VSEFVHQVVSRLASPSGDKNAKMLSLQVHAVTEAPAKIMRLYMKRKQWGVPALYAIARTLLDFEWRTQNPVDCSGVPSSTFTKAA